MVKRDRLQKIKVEKVITKPINRSLSNGGITFVYHECGKRLEFSNNVLEMLGNPNFVDISYADEYMLISAVEDGFALKTMAKRKVIYNASLVKEILDHYSIEYENQTCFTFADIDTVEGEENTIAVKMK